MIQHLFAQGIQGFDALLIFLFGAFGVYFKTLVCFIVVDYVTGVMNGYISKSLSSSAGIKGIFKKISILLCVAVAVQIDKVMGTEFLRLATILCLIGNEGISILENITKLGVPVPDKIVDSLVQLKHRGEDKEDDKHNE